ncbi:hypothetical protein GCM10010329_52280 [Streptomyces spiroverticillatus]|uniref:Uncharacterized protein n=1 Tax=Streptomyces finlayi TaxID=67296 RepID=A0A918X224_9ACTN|nr:hypothetical protein [Streptomyces finlayi]GHA22485.1 hypothetical protein GCM10010329_52280 [Streptomyces spiroverticillatus]GHD04427.1 hypothetical protein GCM10010334_53220 [Streptomyces finlayi]
MTAAPPPGPPPAPDAPADAAPSSGLQRFGALFGAVIAPTSFVTGLLYYFGLNQAYWFYAYFGVNSTALGLGTTDYLVIGVDALFRPMVIAAAGGLVAFWGHELLRARLAAGARPRVLRLLVPVLGGTGLLLTACGLWAVLDTGAVVRAWFLVPPLSLAAGVMLLAYALHLRRTLGPAPAPAPGPAPVPTPAPAPRPDADADPPPPPDPAPPAPPPPVPSVRPEWTAMAEWAVIFLLVGLSLMWAATDYAGAVGRGRAEQLVARLPDSTTAVVHSTRSLALSVPGVREIRCADATSGYPYRYEGLALVIQSANQYVLLPLDWTATTGVAVLLPRSDSVRLEFVPYRAREATLRRPC